jgi:hypothetical protein
MNDELNVIIPMAGIGSRFLTYGFKENKYLLPVDKPLTKMIEKAILTLNIKNHNVCFIFILKEENNVIDYKLRQFLQDLTKLHNYKCKILSVSKLTDGPACSAYEAKQIINNSVPLIISNSDQLLDWIFDNFYNYCNNYDGCVLTYKPNYELVIGTTDKHSFVRFENNIPIEFVEKTVISDEALVGVHYYKQGRYFIDACDYLFKHNIRAPNNEFYLSYTYQAMINIGGYNIGTYRLPTQEFFYPVGEPDDYFKYYNQFTKLPIYKIDEYKNINNYEYFKVDFKHKNEELVVNNELLIIIKGKIHNQTNSVFLCRERNIIKFEEDTYFLRVYNIINESVLNININDYTRGWLIGNFKPSIKQIPDFEIGILTHKQNEKWDFHYHKLCVEINILIEGKININDNIIENNNIFIFDKNVISCPIFLEDCKILCIKIPSNPNDKYMI